MRPSNSHFSAASLKVIVFAFLAVSLFSCKNKEGKPKAATVQETVEEAVMPTIEKGCYSYNENGSMVNLEITKNDNPVAGNLTYALAEKDKNTGTFSGEFKDGKLLATYTFQSEGMESKRQVAFMLKDNQLVEGYGALNEEGTMFIAVDSINYSSTMPLTKTDCEK